MMPGEGVWCLVFRKVSDPFPFLGRRLTHFLLCLIHFKTEYAERIVWGVLP